MVVESVLALNEENLIDQWNWILGCLREVLLESGDGDLAELLPLLGDGAVPLQITQDSVHLTQAYSIAFQLLSMAEQNAADQFRKGVERRSGADALPALWGDSLRQLKESGLTSEQIARQLPKMRVELVLTAHPTEAKRATVLAHHRRLFERFQQRSTLTHSASDRVDPVSEEIDYAVHAILSILWRSLISNRSDETCSIT